MAARSFESDWTIKDNDAAILVWGFGGYHSVDCDLVQRHWGEHSENMAWCSTEEPDAYVGENQVVESLSQELTAIVGDAVYVELRRRLTQS